MNETLSVTCFKRGIFLLHHINNGCMPHPGYCDKMKLNYSAWYAASTRTFHVRQNGRRGRETGPALHAGSRRARRRLGRTNYLRRSLGKTISWVRPLLPRTHVCCNTYMFFLFIFLTIHVVYWLKTSKSTTCWARRGISLVRRKQQW